MSQPRPEVSERLARAAVRLWIAFALLALAYVAWIDATDPAGIPPNWKSARTRLQIYGPPAAVVVAGAILARRPRAMTRVVRWSMLCGVYPLLTVAFVTLVAGEAYFYLAKPVDQVLARDYKDTWCLLKAPNAEYVYRGPLFGKHEPERTIRTNRLGFHDVDHELAKPPGVYRIVVVGDSMVEAMMVEREVTFHRRLEETWNVSGRTPRIEVIAFAQSSLGLVSELALLEQHGFAFQPDLVVCGLFYNDVTDTVYEAKPGSGPGGGARPVDKVAEYWNQAWNPLLKVSVYLELDFPTWMLFKMPPRMTEAAATAAEPEIAEGVEVCREALGKMRDRCREEGAALLVYDLTFHPTTILGRHRRECLAGGGPPCPHAAEAAAAFTDPRIQKWPVIDLGYLDMLVAGGFDHVLFSEHLPEYESEYQALEKDPAALSFPGDMHWSARGHEVAAKILRRRLEEGLPGR